MNLPLAFARLLAIVAAAFLLTIPASAASLTEVSLVDVLLLHTAAAATPTDDLDHREVLRLAVLEANHVLQSSVAGVRLRLVGIEPVNYVESGTTAVDLARLRAGTDEFAGVAALRAQHHADLVCLITASGDIALAGLPGPSKGNAFSVVTRSSVEDLVVALSRNFGCETRRPAATTQPALAFGYGYGFSTGARFVGTVESGFNERLRLFSNPRLLTAMDNPAGLPVGLPLGVPAGVAGAADNARVLSLVAPLVAGFEGGASHTVPPSVSLHGEEAGGRVRFMAAASDPDGQVAQVELFANGRSLDVVTRPPFLFEVDAAYVAGKTVTAVASDDRGAMSASESIVVTVQPDGGLGFVGLSAQSGGIFGSGTVGSVFEQHQWDLDINPLKFPGIVTGPAVNNDFAAREFLVGLSNRVDRWNLFATRETGEPSLDPAANGQTVWWSWQSPADGVLRLSVGDYNVKYPQATPSTRCVVGVLAGATVSDLTTLGAAVGTVDVQVTAGTFYAIAVDTVMNASGWFTLEQIFAPDPPNDSFAHRMFLTEPAFHFDAVAHVNVGGAVTLSGTTLAATKEPGEPDHAANAGGASLWWSWQAPHRGRLSLNPDGTEFPALVAAYRGFTVPTLEQVAAAAGSIDFPVAGGDILAFTLDGKDGAKGNYQLRVAFTPSPVNDDFASAITRLEADPVEGFSPASLSFSGNTHAATAEAGEPLHGTQAENGSLWWNWTAPASGEVEVAAAGPKPVVVGVYVGNSVQHLLTIANGSGTARFYARRGVQYRIAVAGPGEVENLFFAGVQGVPAPRLHLDNASGELRAEGLSGQTFAFQVRSEGGPWTTALIDTVQGGGVLPLAVSPGATGYRVIPLEDLLLPPTLDIDIRRGDSGLPQIIVTGPPAAPFVLLGSDDLSGWNPVATGAVMGDGVLVPDATAASASQRYYQVRPWPLE